MTIHNLVDIVRNKDNFRTLNDYIHFARRYLDFAFDQNNLQAIIVSQNEQQYRFFQYKRDGHFNITRPLNFNLLIDANHSTFLETNFLEIIDNVRNIPEGDTRRSLICNAVYTIQQCIGVSLDALPAGQSNTARKINGDLFERLIRLLLNHVGIKCESGTINIPVIINGIEEFHMSYQHDLIVKYGDVVKMIGSVKTSSKDRLDKIFIDTFLYNKLTDTSVPHVAIFLNDVQRKKSRRPNQYAINSTFLPGRFKGYTVKLCPLDGVYYCDIRPVMTTDTLLRQHIRTIDHFFCHDIWMFTDR